MTKRVTALPPDLVVAALRDPSALPQLALPVWERLVRQARKADLLARIGELLAERGLLAQVPPAPRAHIEAARQVVRAQHDDARREVAHIVRALRPLGLEAVLLKGAAYVLGRLPPATGRLFSDIDLLVPQARLPEVEAGLMLHGWATTHHAEYDQKYYRLWMHELPPMSHIHRHTVLDVHHAILPRTARLKPDSSLLIADAVPVDGLPGVRVLAPVDRVLHSMTHLFHNEELSHGLRDLSDIDLLLRASAGEADFWPRLVARARQLDLSLPLYLGVRHAGRVFGTPIPQSVVDASAAAAPSGLRAGWMDALWLRALRAPHAMTGDRFTPAALFLLYVRAHWLRMPPWPLVKHLTIKALRRPESDPDEARAAP